MKNPSPPALCDHTSGNFQAITSAACVSLDVSLDRTGSEFLVWTQRSVLRFLVLVCFSRVLNKAETIQARRSEKSQNHGAGCPTKDV